MSTSTTCSKILTIHFPKLLNLQSFIVNNNLKIVRNGISSKNPLMNKICWKCGKEREQFSAFCDKCNSVQAPVDKENYFKVLGLKEEFDIDSAYLRDKFRSLQSVLHPDKFSSKSQDEQIISAEYSSLVNKAYSNLQAPLKRAEHLLRLKGESVTENQTIDDPEFLMEMMNLNEEIDDAGIDLEKLKSLNEKNRKELEKLAQNIGQHFEENDIKKAKEYIIKLKYFNSISNRLNQILRELGATD